MNYNDTISETESRGTYADLLLYSTVRSFFAEGILGAISMASEYFAAALAKAFPKRSFLKNQNVESEL